MWFSVLCFATFFMQSTLAYTFALTLGTLEADVIRDLCPVVRVASYIHRHGYLPFFRLLTSRTINNTVKMIMITPHNARSAALSAYSP